MAKVCILTAGKGSRLGSKTSFFNKGLIRVGDKAIISHIIDYFPEDYEFVIVTGYLGDIVKQYVTLAHPNRKVTFVEQKTLNGPGGALLTCQEFLQEPFYIWCADTLIDDFKIDESNNWIGTSIQKKLTDTGYSCMSFNDKTKVTCFHEKNDKCRTNAPYVGVSFVKNPHHFWNYMKDADCIVDGEIQVSTGFRGLDFLAKNFLLWIDAGSEQGLCCARDYFEARIENLDKLDEEIYFLGNRVVKYFHNPKMIENRIKRNISMNGTTPEILDHSNNFYVYEFIEGKDLFCIQNKEDYVEPLLNFAKDNLWKEKSLTEEQQKSFKIICEKFYRQKTEARLKDLYFKLQIEDKEEVINGEKIPKLQNMLEKINWDYLSDGIPATIHGDFNFSNVILTKDNTFKFVDWRQDFGGILEYGDVYYDVSKFLSGLLFPHDDVKKGNFMLSISNSTTAEINRNICYSLCEKKLFSFLKNNKYDIEKVKQLSALILLNMSPLHESRLDSLLYYLGKYLLYKSLYVYTY